MASNPDFEEMTVMDLTTWLGQQEPTEFCEIFSCVYTYFKGIAYFKANCALDNYIDSKEFTKLTEAEVKQMISAIGIAKKIICLIPKVNDSSCLENTQ